MADAGEVNKANGKSKKRRPRYLPHNKPVKKKGPHPLRPGVEGFFLTCDGGRERQATREALCLLDRFYEEILFGKCSDGKSVTNTSKPLNKKIRFSDSDSSGSDEDEKPQPHEEKAELENCGEDTDENPTKKQRLDADGQKTDTTECDKTEEKSTDEQHEDEFEELYDRNKRRFASLDSGCNGVIFIRMNKASGDPGPAKIVEHLMTTAASTRKHMSRFILRLLPAEMTCYASEEEISKAIKPLVAQYFPAEGPSEKFAVLYDARSNTGIERAKIIDAVAKSVPQPYKVDLNNPDKSIVVQIVKTVCLVGVVQRYKELSKYNLRQLTSPKPKL